MVISEGFNPFNPQSLAKVVAPSFMPNGFYITGTSETFNVDGTNGRTELNTKYVIIKNAETGYIIGSTLDKLT